MYRYFQSIKYDISTDCLSHLEKDAIASEPGKHWPT
jgi:hypothetical protein